MRFLLYQHQSSENHGCEALVYTISEQIKKRYPDSYIEITSNYSEHDRRFDFPNIDKIVQNDAWLKRFTFPWLMYQIDKRTFHSKSIQEKFMYCKPCYECAKNDNVLIAIGGDTYCYNQGREHWPIDRKMHKLGKPMMLWGCSIEPNDLSEEMVGHLGNFDVISARESISYEALIKKGVSSRVIQCADSAFELPITPCELPAGWINGKMIGLNFSPMVMGERKTEEKEKFRCAVDSLVEHILKYSDEKIVLIPHVRLFLSDDMAELRPLYERWKDTGRVLLVDDDKLNARQLKYIISNCKIFVGARTHATVAAYSTSVPTLAIGYSVKARGIARDLFGNEENMVIPIADLIEPNKLIDKYQYIYNHQSEIHSQLEKIMPEYRNRSKLSLDELTKLIKMAK